MKALVVVANGLHLGYIGCYGNEWVETPNLDRMAAEGIVFDQHYADQPNAAGAQRAWQTGCYRFPEAVAKVESVFGEPASLLPLLAEKGLGILLLSDSCRAESTASAAFPEELLRGLVKALDQLAPCKEWLLKLDLGVLLPPWNTPDELRNRHTPKEPDEDGGELPSFTTELEALEEIAYRELQDRYVAVVIHLDKAFGQVLYELEQRGLLNNMLVVLTSNHGQIVGEDVTRQGSRRLLHEELIHIPLILRLPGKAEAGRRISAFTQSVDLLPTLFEAFGVPLPAVHGSSLLPLARGESNQIREYACAGLRRDDTVEWALRSSHWAFYLPVSSPSADVPAESELYVKPDDRWEVNNVRQQQLELAERLEHTLRGFVEATRSPGPLRPPKLTDDRLKDEQDRVADPTEGSFAS